jgi:hypothetical protein
MKKHTHTLLIGTTLIVAIAQLKRLVKLIILLKTGLKATFSKHSHVNTLCALVEALRSSAEGALKEARCRPDREDLEAEVGAEMVIADVELDGVIDAVSVMLDWMATYPMFRIFQDAFTGLLNEMKTAKQAKPVPGEPSEIHVTVDSIPNTIDDDETPIHNPSLN